MVYYQKMTPEGYQEIKDEIARLKKDRPRRIKILQEAGATVTVEAPAGSYDVKIIAVN